jgi:pyruvate-formate lyase-activating enzyme
MTPTTATRTLWLELTTRCQLACTHCYNDSGPDRDDGPMTMADWRHVIDQASELGVKLIQFIGGEVTLHPDLAELVTYTLDQGMKVEVYSNLVHVTPQQWRAFSRPGARLATSWYTDDPDQHRQITSRPTYRQTLANITEAVNRGIPIRVGLVSGIIPDQRVAEAKAQLAALGITDVRVDRERGLGRAAPGRQNVGELCGRCGDGKAAVLPDGSVAGCPMARWLNTGNTRQQPLAALLAQTQQTAATMIRPAAALADCSPSDGCDPPCEPESGCDPSATYSA